MPPKVDPSLKTQDAAALQKELDHRKTLKILSKKDSDHTRGIDAEKAVQERYFANFMTFLFRVQAHSRTLSNWVAVKTESKKKAKDVNSQIAAASKEVDDIENEIITEFKKAEGGDGVYKGIYDNHSDRLKKARVAKEEILDAKFLNDYYFITSGKTDNAKIGEGLLHFVRNSHTLVNLLARWNEKLTSVKTAEEQAQALQALKDIIDGLEKDIATKDGKIAEQAAEIERLLARPVGAALADGEVSIKSEELRQLQDELVRLKLFETENAGLKSKLEGFDGKRFLGVGEVFIDEAELFQLKKNKADLELKLKPLEDELAVFKRQDVEQKKATEEQQRKIKEQEDAIRGYLKAIEERDVEIARLNAELGKGADDRYLSAQAANEKLKEQIKELEGAAAASKAKLEEEGGRYALLEKQVAELKVQNEDLTKQLAAAKEKIAEQERKAEEDKNTIAQREVRIKELETQLLAAKAEKGSGAIDQDLSAENARLRDENKKLKEALKESLQEANTKSTQAGGNDQGAQTDDDSGKGDGAKTSTGGADAGKKDGVADDKAGPAGAAIPPAAKPTIDLELQKKYNNKFSSAADLVFSRDAARKSRYVNGVYVNIKDYKDRETNEIFKDFLSAYVEVLGNDSLAVDKLNNAKKSVLFSVLFPELTEEQFFAFLKNADGTDATKDSKIPGDSKNKNNFCQTEKTVKEYFVEAKKILSSEDFKQEFTQWAAARVGFEIAETSSPGASPKQPITAADVANMGQKEKISFIAGGH